MKRDVSGGGRAARGLGAVGRGVVRRWARSGGTMGRVPSAVALAAAIAGAAWPWTRAAAQGGCVSVMTGAFDSTLAVKGVIDAWTVWTSGSDLVPTVYVARKHGAASDLYRVGSQGEQLVQSFPFVVTEMGVWDVDGDGGLPARLALFRPGTSEIECAIPPTGFSYSRVVLFDGNPGQYEEIEVPLSSVSVNPKAGCPGILKPLACSRMFEVEFDGVGRVLALAGYAMGEDFALAMYDGAGWTAVRAGGVEKTGYGSKILYDGAVFDPDGSGPFGERLALCGMDFSYECGSGCPPTQAAWMTQFADGVSTAFKPEIPASYQYARAIATFDPDGPSGPAPESLVVRAQTGQLLRLAGGAWITMGQPIQPPVVQPGITLYDLHDLVVHPASGAMYCFESWNSPGLPLPGYMAAYRFDGSKWIATPGNTIERIGNVPWRNVTVVFDRDGPGPIEPSLLLQPSSIELAGPSRYKVLAQFAGHDSYIPFGESLDNHVHALVEHDDGSGSALFAGGKFIYAGGRLAVGVAKWNGAEWAAVGGGMNNHVDVLASYKGSLIAGGKFTAAGNGVKAGGLARWDGTAWSPLGNTGAPVRALTVIGEDLYAGGLFTQVGSGPTKVLANRVARYDGTKWWALGGVGGGVNGAVNAIGSYNGEVVVGGGFTQADGANGGGGSGSVKAGGLASWDGASWKGMGFFGAPVKAIEAYKGDLYVGGAFKQVSGVAAFRIARWDGSAWSAVGPTDATQGAINALRVVDLGAGPVLAAGSAGSVMPGNTARIGLWDGATWTAVDAGPSSASGAVRAIATADADGAGPSSPAMYVGGLFNGIGTEAKAFLAEFVGCDGRPGSPIGGEGDGAGAALMGEPCDADCDGNGALDAADLACFHSLFTARDARADCDGDGRFTTDDYVCFQAMVARGC